MKSRNTHGQNRTDYDAEQLLAGSCFQFHREIADSARYGNRSAYDRRYELTKSEGGVVAQGPKIKIYSRHDSCFLIGDEFENGAYCISQFEVHGLVRDLLDTTEYVLTYYDSDWLSEDAAETLGVVGDV